MARLIDTSVWIALERRGESLSALDEVTNGEPFALASITASELLVGVHRAATQEQRERRLDFVESVLDHVPILPFDLVAARAHAQVIVTLSAVGRAIGSNDSQIAAIALASGYVLLTHNLRHFERVPGLVAQRPDW